MQKKLLGILLVFGMLCSMLFLAVPAGAAEETIEISTAEQLLKLMGEDAEYPWDGTYKLTADKDEESVPIYYYFLEAFDLKTETFSQTHLVSPIFASELEMLDAIYELYDDEVFKERVD